MKSHWRTWKGRDVMHLDYAGFKRDVEGLRSEVAAADAVICAQRPGSVLALIDLRDTVASTAVVQLFKESAAQTTPYIHRHALVGVSGMKKFFAEKIARLIGKPMRLFDDEQTALDWLVDQAGDAGVEVGRRAT